MIDKSEAMEALAVVEERVGELEATERMLRAQLEEIAERGLDNVKVVKEVLEEVAAWAGHPYSGLARPKKIPFKVDMQLVLPISEELEPALLFDTAIGPETVMMKTISVDMFELRTRLRAIPTEDRMSLHVLFAGDQGVTYSISRSMLLHKHSRYAKEEIARQVVRELTGESL